MAFLPCEQRRVQRLSGHTVGPLHLRVDPVPYTLSANVENISIQGVALLADQCFVPGTPVMVECGPLAKPLRSKLVARVRHATALPDGRWLLGCEFGRLLTVDDIEMLG